MGRVMILLAFCIVWVFVGRSQSQPQSQQERERERERDRIRELPGQPEGVNFAQYSGYVTVNETGGRALFYWLVESPKPETRPLVLFLTGGPGCSSIAYGSVQEIGPFRIYPDGKSLYSNPYAWNKLANVMFLESPAGVGFSYSNTTSDLYGYGDQRAAEDSYTFLVNWFARFPQYKHREFYIVGDSYSGHYVPQLSQIVYQQNKGVQNPAINFKGFMVGNAVLDDYYDLKGTFEFWWTNGLISDSMYATLQVVCKNVSIQHLPEECSSALSLAYAERGNINIYSLYTTPCNYSAVPSKPPPVDVYDPCQEAYPPLYFNRPEVQKAMHANVTRLSYSWQSCSEIISGNWGDSPLSMFPIYKELIAGGVRIWVYSGDTDGAVPVAATRYSVKALNLPTLVKWYPWYDNDRQVGGWSQIYKGLTFVTVHRAGHLVPPHRPRQALTLFGSFLQEKPMPTA